METELTWREVSFIEEFDYTVLVPKVQSRPVWTKYTANQYVLLEAVIEFVETRRRYGCIPGETAELFKCSVGYLYTPIHLQTLVGKYRKLNDLIMRSLRFKRLLTKWSIEAWPPMEVHAHCGATPDLIHASTEPWTRTTPSSRKECMKVRFAWEAITRKWNRACSELTPNKGRKPWTRAGTFYSM